MSLMCLVIHLLLLYHQNILCDCHVIILLSYVRHHVNTRKPEYSSDASVISILKRSCNHHVSIVDDRELKRAMYQVSLNFVK